MHSIIIITHFVAWIVFSLELLKRWHFQLLLKLSYLITTNYSTCLSTSLNNSLKLLTLSWSKNIIPILVNSLMQQKYSGRFRKVMMYSLIKPRDSNINRNKKTALLLKKTVASLTKWKINILKILCAMTQSMTSTTSPINYLRSTMRKYKIQRKTISSMKDKASPILPVRANRVKRHGCK